jgi:hypothetical protein
VVRGLAAPVQPASSPDLVPPAFVRTPAQAAALAGYLQPQLVEQAKLAQVYDAYYKGEAIPPLCVQDYLEVFGDDHGVPLLEPPRANISRIGVDAVAERLRVDGFRTIGSGSADASPGEPDLASAAAEDFWAANDMDVMSGIGFTEAIIKSTAALLAWPGADGKAVMTVEDAEQMVLHRQSAPPYGVDAALKVAVDEWTGNTVGWLWTPNAGMWPLTMDPRSSRWVAAVEPEMLPPQARGQVTIAELAQRQRLLDPAQSELVDVAPLADMFNFLLAQMGIAASFGAVPVRTATGIKYPRILNPDGTPFVDPVTKQQVIDPEAALMDIRADRLLTSENKDARFGTLDAANLAGYVAALSQLMSTLRGQTGVPQHYYEGAPAGTSSETLIAAEANLVRRSNRMQPGFGAGIRRGVKFGLLIDGSQYAGATLTPKWKDTDTRSTQQEVSAAAQEVAMGVPLQVVLAETLHWPQNLIDRTMALAKQQQQQAQDLLGQARQLVAPPKPPTLPPLLPIAA